MGRQWLLAKRLVAGQKKARSTGKLVREISVAAKMGGADPDSNARLFTAIEKARKESVSKDAIDRAIQKGAGTASEKLVMEHMVFEGYAPYKVPVIVEVYTDNGTRTAPEIKVLFKKGQIGTSGSNKFLFQASGIVEAYHADLKIDLEAAAISAGANEFEPLSHDKNDDIPESAAGCKFLCDRSDVHLVAKWLTENQWTVVTSELGYIPKQLVSLTDAQKAEVGEFLQSLEDHDDVHRVWAAIE